MSAAKCDWCCQFITAGDFYTFISTVLAPHYFRIYSAMKSDLAIGSYMQSGRLIETRVRTVIIIIITNSD